MEELAGTAIATCIAGLIALTVKLLRNNKE